MRNFILNSTVKAICVISEAKTRIMKVLCEKRGEGMTDVAVNIMISVVIGALILSGLYLLFKNTVLPTLTTKVLNMFNYQ